MDWSRFLKWWDRFIPARIATPFASFWVNGNTPIYVDTGDLFRVYQQCPHLSIVIDRKAEMFSNAEIKLVNAKDETKIIESHAVLDLLKKPNPLQDQEAFLRQYALYKSVWGNAFIYKLSGTSFSMPKALYNLPSATMKVIPTGKIFKQTKLEEIISKYEMQWNGTPQYFEVSEILHKHDGNSANILTGESKIISLKLPISNIDGALKTRNIIINKKGAIGILSNESKDESGALPLSEAERARIEKEYQRQYGIEDGQAQVIITNSALKWSPMSYPTKDLMLFEEIEDDFAAIIGAYGLYRDIFPSVKGATFENQKEATKATYENGIQPFADDLMTGLTTFLGLDQQGLKLIANYSWLPIMQADKQKEEATEKTKAEKLSIMLRDRVISPEAYAEMMGVDYTGKDILT